MNLYERSLHVSASCEHHGRVVTCHLSANAVGFSTQGKAASLGRLGNHVDGGICFVVGRQCQSQRLEAKGVEGWLFGSLAPAKHGGGHQV